MLNFLKRIFSKKDDYANTYASKLSKAMTDELMVHARWNNIGYRIGYNIAMQSFEGMETGQLVLEPELIEYLEKICSDFEERGTALATFNLQMEELISSGKIKFLHVKTNQSTIKIWVHGKLSEHDIHTQLQRIYGNIPEYIVN